MNIKSLKNHLKHLKEHQQLIKDRIRERQDAACDFEVTMLKKQKLGIKDEIQRMKRMIKDLKAAQ